MKPSRQPDYIWQLPGHNLLQHLGHTVITLRYIMRDNPGLGEPAKITTDWRDDGNEPGEHNGWVSVVEWPVEIKG